MRQLFSHKYGWVLGVLVFGLSLGLLYPLTSTAHVVPEEPWHPVPAAYLRALFYTNLKPIDWQLIAQEYESPIEESGYDAKTVFDLIGEAQNLTDTDHVAAIRTAIADEDATALHAASTRAISALTRFHLAQAAEKLTEPGAAFDDVATAQRFFRAFNQNFIEQADPEAFQRLGLVWLDLLNSVGNAGILGVGRVDPDPEAFAAARQVVEDYLATNYEMDEFTVRGQFAPIPEIAPQVNLRPWLPPGTDLNNQDPLPRLVLNFEERGIDEADLFLVAYGDMLFDSPEIFGDPARSLGITCSMCHNRSDINQRFFIPGISPQPGAADVDGHFFNARFNDFRNDALDIPSLRGLRFTAPYGRDGRFASLRDFTRNVIVNEFAGQEPTPLMLDALVAYQLEFDWLPAPYLNADGTLNDQAPEAAQRGEVLFNTAFEGMGNRACSTCHIASSNFMDGLSHDIGSGNPASPGARDSFFNTPTLLNIQYTAPYFHDGSQETLGDVVSWFNDRFDLDLSDAQQADLTAYLEAVGTGQDPFEIFDEENTQFALDWAELSTFLSTLDTLIPAQDTFHALLLLDTVTPDLRLDASAATNRVIIPRVYETADKLDEIRAAIEAGDWDRAAELNEEYKALAEEFGPEFR
ncbi:MAG: cytochrome c peroxidase [Anaerolineae bacterium]|nr:cytochrome c peroxidase [Anaerolineae bacterium]